MNRFYDIVCFCISITARLLFRLEVIGVNNVPASGPVILASNHASNLDPPLIAARLSRQCHVLAKEELFSVPLLGWLIRHLNARPIRRGVVDRAALRQCADVLNQGNILIIFPEGTRTRDGRLQEAKPGAAMIAAITGAPIVPVYLDGTFGAMPRGRGFPRPRKVKIYIGKPFIPPSGARSGTGSKRELYELLAAEMMARIAELKPADAPPRA